jgi:hypothetical protein
MLESEGASLIVGDLVIMTMLVAVDFDDQSCRQAAEVGNIGTESDLPPKV